MQFILINCTPKLKTMGIDPLIDGWQEQLTSKLSNYLIPEGWSYNYDTDTLAITPALGTSVSTNLTDFGDAGGILP